MLQKKNKIIFLYFFLFILLGSINNIKFKQIEFYKIKKIKITGLSNYEKEIILKDINNLNLENIFFLNGKEINQILSSNTLVEKFKIYKRYPSTLLIEIKKTNFLAKINYDGKIYLVGSNGKLTKDKLSQSQLPYIFGNPDINEFLIIKKIIDESKISYEQIKNLYFFKSKRWDLELKNNVILKLSNENIKNSLDIAFELLVDSKFQNIKLIDSRIKDQIIINDWRIRFGNIFEYFA